MKFRIFSLILTVFVFFIMLQAGHSYAQQANKCQPHTVCVNPGDMLQYNIVLRDINSSETYNFINMSDTNDIRIIQNQSDNNTSQNTVLILNLKTGFAHSEQDPTAIRPFLEVLPSPVYYNKSDTSITPIVTEFNGFKRTALVAFHSGENATSKIEYDIESGILLEEHSSSIVTINGNPILVDFSDKLSSTNMINSDSQSITPQGSISIPKWVKSTARSWSQGGILDSEFINAIQYLISNGIMHIPHGVSSTSSSQSIPTWVKHSTGMWAEDQITDNEFVQSIQWLISKGIVQVGN